jgi:hypothetical protein
LVPPRRRSVGDYHERYDMADTDPYIGDSMFPEGVIYEGVGDEKVQFFRGESGANDSMSVPSG